MIIFITQTANLSSKIGVLILNKLGYYFALNNTNNQFKFYLSPFIYFQSI
jgi:hypothetical protein